MVVYPGGTGGEGSVVYRLYLPGLQHTVKFEIQEDEMQSFQVTTPDGHMEVDLPTGRLTVDSGITPLPEHLALAFAIGVMFVTIQKSSVLQVSVSICRSSVTNYLRFRLSIQY
jgi:hypothetical protein